MVNLPGIDLNVRTIDLGASGVDVETGASRSAVDVSVATPVAAVSLHIGLDRLLNTTSPIERLLHSPDPLSRFRAGEVPSDPAPAMTRGMSLRVGDIHAEIATRFSIGGLSTPEVALRADVRTGGDPLLAARVAVGSDTRGVGAVRDPAEAAALPQRINGAAGATASERGLAANVALGTAAGAGAEIAAKATLRTVASASTGIGTNAPVGLNTAVGIAPGVATGGLTSASLDVSFHGLVNILDRAGAPLATPRDAPVGAVLLYARADGGTVVELRTAQGFAGATTTRTLPLTGTAPGRAGEGYTLIGVFVSGELARPQIAAVAPKIVDKTIAPPVNSTTANAAPVGSLAIDRSGAAVAAAPVAAAMPAAAATAGVEAGAAAAVRNAGDGTAPAMLRGDAAASAVPPPDGSNIPAGQAVAPGERRPGIGDAPSNPDASDRPYIDAIWYDILALRFAEAGVSLLDRSTALRDVVWATAMEHGPFAAADGGDVLSRVAADIDLSRADDATIVAALYAERGRLDDAGGLAHYPEVMPFDQARVSERLVDEADLAARRIVTT